MVSWKGAQVREVSGMMKIFCILMAGRGGGKEVGHSAHRCVYLSELIKQNM